MHETARLGRITELLAEAKLLTLGFPVYHPTVDIGVDFYIDAGPRLVGIQVKGARLSNRNGGAQQTWAYRFKRKPLADFFLLYGFEDDAWFVVPKDMLPTKPCGINIKRDCDPNPGGQGRPSKAHQFHSYKEAWQILGQ